MEDIAGISAWLEAAEACRCTFNGYLHPLDSGLNDEPLEVFAPDALLEVMDFPPNSEQLATGTLRDGRPAVVGARTTRG